MPLGHKRRLRKLQSSRCCRQKKKIPNIKLVGFFWVPLVEKEDQYLAATLYHSPYLVININVQVKKTSKQQQREGQFTTT